MPGTIPELLTASHHAAPGAEAILAPGRQELSYAALCAAVHEVVADLNAFGIGRNDRVAVVLPNGPEMAVSFLAVSCGATCAPLNPAYRADEFEFYLSDLNTKAVLLPAGSDSPARAAAAKLEIPVVEVTVDPGQPAGQFSLGDSRAAGKPPVFAETGDIALVLHTSGTTSRPKIVPLTHANLAASAGHIREALALTQRDRCLNVMPLFHIYGLIGAVLSTLAARASIVCTPGFQAPRFFGWLDEFRPTWYTAVPTMHQTILARADANRDVLARVQLRFLRSSSSALAPQVMAELEETFGAPVIESYGMTEASHQMASNPLPPAARKAGSVGVAAGPRIAIMDSVGHLLPPGTAGEVVIRGPNVTSGYENNPAANEGAYTDGWFRTGDQGYLDDEDYLFLTGRLKEIINRAGEKISPREIDEVLMDHPAVAQAVAFALPDEKLGEDVGAAIVLRDGETATETELREFAAERLADFKVPRKIVLLEAIPKGPTGKLQRIGLAEKLGLDRPASTTGTPPASFVAPTTETEKRISALWTDVLGVEEIGIHDNFFEIGGDSVLGAMLLSRLENCFGSGVTMVRLFESPTVAALAGWLDDPSRQRSPVKASILRRPQPSEPLVSFQQQWMWFMHELAHDKAVLNRPAAFRITGKLDLDIVEESLNRVVTRHEPLRTSFRDAEDGIEAFDSGPRRLRLPLFDLSEQDEATREEQSRDIVTREALTPFDLSRDLLLRAAIVRHSPEEHLLLLTMHHISSDGWSTEVRRRDFLETYSALTTGKDPVLTGLPVQYSDFAQWQREQLHGKQLHGLLAYWKNQLTGELPALQVPADFPRRPNPGNRGSQVRSHLSADVSRKAKDLAHRHNCTLFTVLLAAFQTLLHRYTSSTDFVIGTPVAGRNRAELEPMIGLFINTLALRTDLGGDPSFRELLGRVWKVTAGALAHEDLPLQRLVEELAPERRGSLSPLFQVLFQLRNVPRSRTTVEGLRIEQEPLDTDLLDTELSLETEDGPDGIRCTLRYNTALFTAETAQRMLRQYERLLESAVADPDRKISGLDLLTTRERRLMLETWNETTAQTPDGCIHELIERQAQQNPDNPAVRFRGKQLSYRELNEQANCVAHHLRGLGAGPEKIVGVTMGRSIERVVALLGVLKAGAAYAPLTPATPKRRLTMLLEDLEPSVLICQRSLSLDLPESGCPIVWMDEDWDRIAENPRANPASGVGPANMACLIYTSGSTGTPKAVVVEHRKVVDRLSVLSRIFPENTQDRALLLASYGFDVSIAEIFGTLCAGACAVVLGPDEHRDPAAVVRVLSEEKITLLHCVPSMLGELVGADGFSSCASLRSVVSGGEPLPATLRDAFFERCACRLYNLYGPTEVTIWATVWHCEREGRDQCVPIGRPGANTLLYVLDGNGQPVPIGVTGELYIGGTCVARGYHRRPELTSERFLPNPFRPGTRFYRTGDQARYRPDGALEFIGRLDHQVQIRGNRVELGEIETVLRQHPAVKDATVACVEKGPSDVRLAAYIQAGGRPPSSTELRGFLSARLQPYMVPNSYTFLQDFPKNANGKLDRASLPPPEPQAGELAGESLAPRNGPERRLAKIWEEVLAVERVGIRDNFFELGGHSLLAVRLSHRIEQEFGRRLPLAMLFEEQTVESLAAALGKMEEPENWSPLITLRTDGDRPPLVLLHGHGGNLLFYRELVKALGPDQPVYGFQSPGLDGARPVPGTIEELADLYVRELLREVPQGPYCVAGFCVGAYIAAEMARRLQQQNKAVAFVGSINADGEWHIVETLAESIRYHLRNLRGESWRNRFVYIRERLAYRYRLLRRPFAEAHGKRRLVKGRKIAADQVPRYVDAALMGANRRYMAKPFAGKLHLFQGDGDSYRDGESFWDAVASDGVELYRTPGRGIDVLSQPHVITLAQLIREAMDQAIGSGDGQSDGGATVSTGPVGPPTPQR